MKSVYRVTAVVFAVLMCSGLLSCRKTLDRSSNEVENTTGNSEAAEGSEMSDTGDISLNFDTSTVNEETGVNTVASSDTTAAATAVDTMPVTKKADDTAETTRKAAGADGTTAHHTDETTAPIAPVTSSDPENNLPLDFD